MIKRAIKSSVKQDINGCVSKSLCFSFCDEIETNMSSIRASLVARRYGNIVVLEYSSEMQVDLWRLMIYDFSLSRWFLSCVVVSWKY